MNDAKKCPSCGTDKNLCENSILCRLCYTKVLEHNAGLGFATVLLNDENKPVFEPSTIDKELWESHEKGN